MWLLGVLVSGSVWAQEGNPSNKENSPSEEFQTDPSTDQPETTSREEAPLSSQSERSSESPSLPAESPAAGQDDILVEMDPAPQNEESEDEIVIEMDAAPDQGSPADEPSQEMDGVVVTATRSTTSKLNTTVAVDALRQSDLEKTMPTNVGDAVEQVPGVSLNSPAGVFFSNPNIRGLGGRRVIMLLDGRRMDTEKTMGVTGYFVGMGDVKRIEVVRGPGSILYGSDALGGVVNIITPDPLDQDGASADYRLTLGSNNGEIANEVAGGWANEVFGVKSRVLLREADDYTTGGGDRIANSDFKDRIFSLKMALRLHPKHTLRLLGDAYLGGDIGKAESEADREAFRRVHFPHDRHYMAMLSYDGVDLGGPWMKLHLSGYFDYTDRHQHMGFYTEDYSRIVTDKHKYGEFMSMGGSTYALLNPWTGNDLTFGGDFFHKTLNMEDTTQAAIPGIETPVTRVNPFDGARQVGGGVFLQDQQNFGERWILIGGVRWDGIDNDYPQDEEDTQTDFDQAVSGNLGLLFHPIESMSLTLNGGRAFRSPTLKEKFVEVSSCKGDLCGNPDVRPETSWNLDAGIKGYWDFLTYEAYFFNIFINDYITLDASDRENCQFEYTNIGEAWLIGGEGRLTFDFQHIYKSLGLKFWSSFSYVRGEDRRNGEPLAQVPPLRNRSGIQFYGSSRPVLKRFYVEFVTKYNARQDRIAPAEEGATEVEKVTGEYFLMDASLGFKFMPFTPGISVDAFLKASNLADTAYRDHLATIDGMGRNLKLGLAVHYY